VNLANFAAAASQGHIGRARYLARDQAARDTRNDILKLPTMIVDVASAFAAAGKLVDAAKSQAEADAQKKNDAELAALKEAWGQQGSKVVAGGAKAVKELEKDQKSRQEHEWSAITWIGRCLILQRYIVMLFDSDIRWCNRRVNQH
jgi:DNA polymerase-3 subunit delta'